MGAKGGHLGRPEAPGDLTGGEKGTLERRWESLWKTYHKMSPRLTSECLQNSLVCATDGRIFRHCDMLVGRYFVKR